MNRAHSIRGSGLPLPGFVALFALGAAVGGVGPLGAEALAYRHEESRIRYQEYSQAAFDQARREDKPVYLLLSAAWCLWCRYFQEETLEQPEVARLLNTRFIPIFVDLDRRQDLQHQYVRKGIPTSVIFTAEGKEFLSFSGTLKKDEFLAGIRQVLATIGKPGSRAAAEPMPTVRDVRPQLAPGRLGDAATLRAAALGLRRAFQEAVRDNVDPEHGGLGRQSKYPQALVWSDLLLRPPEQDPPVARKAVEAALGQVVRHLYDPVAGGFYRYAENRDWSRPHYEKMLAPNVRLLHAFTLVAKAAGDGNGAGNEPPPGFDAAAVAGHALEFLLNVLYRADGGGFYGSLDGRHPRYYRLDAAGRAATTAAPELDRTIYTAGNGEAIHLLAAVYRLRPEPRLRAALEATLKLMRGTLLSAANGMHSHLRPDSGQAEGEGQLKDNSWGALALVTGYELTGDPAYLRSFEQVLDYARRRLYLPAAGAFRLWNVPAGRGWRTGENVSAAVPLDSNGVMALALVQAYRATGKTAYRELAERLLGALGRLDPWLFDDDPDDPGKVYLSDFVYLLRAQDLLIQSRAKPS